MEYMRNQLAAVGNLSDSKEINALRGDIAKLANHYSNPNTAEGWHSNNKSPNNYETRNSNNRLPFNYNTGNSNTKLPFNYDTNMNYPTNNNTNYPANANSASIKPSLRSIDKMDFLSPEDLGDQVMFNPLLQNPSDPMLQKLIEERNQLLMNGYEINDP